MCIHYIYINVRRLVWQKCVSCLKQWKMRVLSEEHRENVRASGNDKTEDL